MGFETRTVQRASLAPDLPNPSTAAQQHPDGAVYASEATDQQFRGKKYRLRHARWVPVTVRKKDSNGSAKKK